MTNEPPAGPTDDVADSPDGSEDAAAAADQGDQPDEPERGTWAELMDLLRQPFETRRASFLRFKWLIGGGAAAGGLLAILFLALLLFILLFGGGSGDAGVAAGDGGRTSAEGGGGRGNDDGGGTPYAAPAVADLVVVGNGAEAPPVSEWTVGSIAGLPQQRVDLDGGGSVSGVGLLELMDASGHGDWRTLVVLPAGESVDRSEVNDDWIVVEGASAEARYSLAIPGRPSAAWPPVTQLSVTAYAE
jgi:hypothetical protein